MVQLGKAKEPASHLYQLLPLVSAKNVHARAHTHVHSAE